MRTLKNCLAIFLVLQCQKTEAASSPLSRSFALSTLDTGLNNSHKLTPSFHITNQKVGFIKNCNTKFYKTD
jgi:hypothetical protein